MFSILCHFMLFSGVTWPKLAWMMAAFLPAVRRPWSAQVPKYSLPLAFIRASMLTDAWRVSMVGAARAASGARRSKSPDFMLEMWRGCWIGSGFG